MSDRISPRWRKVLRDATLNKGRSVAAVLAITIGMVAAGALLDTWAVVRRVTLETYAASHPASATLGIGTAVSDDLLEQIRAVPGVASARRRGHAFASAQIGGKRYTADLFALDDFAQRDISVIEGEGGAWPPRDGEIAIEKSSMEFSGASLGTDIELQRGSDSLRLHVTGVAHDVGVAPGWMDHVVYGFLTPATLASLGVAPSRNELQLLVSDSALDRDAVRRIASQVRTLLERNGIIVSRVEVPVPGQHPHAAQMDSLIFVQGAFGALTLLAVSFLILNLVAAVLAREKRQIGVMKALGAGTNQIAALYLTSAFFLGAAASVIALPAALAIGRNYAALKADMLNFSIAGFATPWWAIALQVAIGCALPVLAALWPVTRACRMRVTIALHDAGVCGEQGAFIRRRIVLPGVGRPLMLSIANTFRRRQRTLLTLLALSIGGAVFIGADNLRHAVVDSIDRTFATQRYDVMLQFAAPHPARDLEAAAAQVDGVTGAQALLADQATVMHADREPGEPFTLVGVAPDSSLFRADIEHGRWLDTRDENAVVLSQRLLREEPQLKIGGEVVLKIREKTSAWRIVGSDQTAVQMVAYAPFATLAAQHGNDQATTLAVSLRGASVSQLAAVMRLRASLDQAAFRVAGSQLISESRRSLEDHLLMVIQFLEAMSWVMIAVGAMGLASTMSLAVLERTREIGVLRAIGATHGAIARIVQIEGLVIVVLAWLLSIVLSVPIGAFLSDAFGRIMFPVPTSAWPHLRTLMIWLLLSVTLSVFACMWPARRAMRFPVAKALGYE